MIELIRGSDEAVLIELFSDDAELVPFDLTNATVSVVNATVTPTPLITDYALGKVTVSFTDAQTTAMKKDRPYIFRLKFSWPDTTDLVTPDFVVVAQ